MTQYREYKAEELLPIVTRLADKYTSHVSSSVTYETAQQLMSAVIYCLNENESNSVFVSEKPDEGVLTETSGADLQTQYERGHRLVIKKVRAAKKLYDEIISDFQDYGCRNYRDTILKGMPSFFLYYDPLFNPQSHRLTLDYPLLNSRTDLTGVDLIYEYLKGIMIEKQVLGCFEVQSVEDCLSTVIADYRELFMDNMCEFVLGRALESFMIHQTVDNLILTAGDYELLKGKLSGLTADQIEQQVMLYLQNMADSLAINADYFAKCGHGLAVRFADGRMV